MVKQIRNPRKTRKFGPDTLLRASQTPRKATEPTTYMDSTPMNQTPTRASTFMARLLAMKANPANRQQQVNAKPAKRPAPPALVDQIRAVLASWPESQRRKISALVLLPHLQGKYRDHTHLRMLGAALRQLGYKQAPRTWGKDNPDFGRRFWVLDETN